MIFESKELKKIVNKIGAFMGKQKKSSVNKIMVKAEKYSLTILGFCADGWICFESLVESERDFTFVLTFSEFSALIESAGQVEFCPQENKVKAGKLAIETSADQNVIGLGSYATFAERLKSQEGKIFEFGLNGADFGELFEKVAFAADDQSTRYALNCVAIGADDAGKPVFCATNGFCLSLAGLENPAIPEFHNSQKGLIVPARLLGVADSVIGKRDFVSLVGRDNGALLLVAQCQKQIVKACFEPTFGRFPNVRQVIEPTKDGLVSNNRATLTIQSSKAFAALIEKAQTKDDDGNKRIKLTINDQGRLFVGEIEAGAGFYCGNQPARLCYDAAILLDYLATQSGSIDFAVELDRDWSKPGFFSTQKTIFVIMPIKA